MIKLNKKTPYDISLRTEFKIGASDTEYLQTYIFTEETCEPTFHLEIKTAGKNYLVTKPVTQKIFIPLYDDDIYLSGIKRWVEENGIENYQYNDNPSLQKEIEYKVDFLSCHHFIFEVIRGQRQPRRTEGLPVRFYYINQ